VALTHCDVLLQVLPLGSEEARGEENLVDGMCDDDVAITAVHVQVGGATPGPRFGIRSSAELRECWDPR